MATMAPSRTATAVLEDHAVWFDRDDEAGFDEGVAGFRDLVGHSFPAFQPAFRQNVGWVGFINPAACTGCWVGEADPAYGLRVPGAGSVELTQPTGPRPGSPLIRSEEHTSELQSLMRISYAVYCLK